VTSESGLFDLHSHLVPGVDDGAREPSDTVDGLRRMREVGISDVITTPHFNAAWTLDPAIMEQWGGKLEAAWPAVESAAEEVGMRVQRGHEIMLDVPDADLSDPRLHLGDSRVLLLEWPRLQVPPGSAAAITRVLAQGLRPLVAHPERYAGLDPGLSLVADWKEAGALLQTNYGSIVGRYGPKVRQVALELLERGWVDVLSTDFHGRGHLKLYIKEAREVFEECDASEAWQLLSGTNARRLLQDQPPIPPPPLVRPRSLVERLRGWALGR